MANIHIFKPGTHTDMHGRERVYSEVELQGSAAAYDPAKWRAPIVIGHPRTDSPAYGWVDTLDYAEPEGLFAEPAEVMAEFAEAVRAGHWRNVSASFWLPDAPNNPVPGSLYLRHVGFLGATPPAIKGLQPVAFAADEAGVVEFGDIGHEFSATVFRRLREWLLAKFGAADADQVVPDWVVDALKEEARPAPKPEPTAQEPAIPAFAEADALKAEVARLKAALDARQAADLAAARAVRHGEHAAFAESLVQAGKLPPKHSATIVAALDALHADTPVEFGEGEARQPLLPALQAVLEALPVQVSFSDMATPARVAADARRVANPLVADAERRAGQPR